MAEPPTSGQALGLEQLHRIARANRSALRVNYDRPAERPAGNLEVNISIDCSSYEQVKGGLALHARESVTLSIPPDFPYEIPSIDTVHRRFAGHPHVQWGRHLCIYQSPETQWQPAQGMFGLIRQLADWLEKGARNQLDAEGGPIHPPVAYSFSSTTVCVHADTPGKDQWPWFGAATLDWAKDDLFNLVEWRRVGELPADEFFAPAVLLDFELPFEYPLNLAYLLRCLERGKVPTTRLLAHMMLAAERATEGDAMHVVIGTPARGIVGRPDERQQHLQVWEIEWNDVLRLKAVALACDIMNSYQEDGASDELQAVIDSVFESLAKWKKTSKVNWCRIFENRPEIVTRRDEDTPMDWFRGKSVALWGCGALGGQIAEQLVRAGVGELRLYDNSRVHPGILVRQNFTAEDVNINKARALKDRLLAINPHANVTPYAENVVEITLNDEHWDAGLDLVIDATASLRVRSKLEKILKDRPIRVPTVSMMISGRARYGAVVIVPTHYSGGPLDALRRLSLATKTRTWLKEPAEAFWGEDSSEVTRQPEPGCSDPTFVASLADVANLCARMMNHAADALTESDCDAVGVLIDATATLRDTRFEFPPDTVVTSHDIEFRLSPNAWRDARAWIRAGSRQRSEQHETGGLMFGAIDEVLGVAWISHVSGPPPDSAFSPQRFDCGTEGVDALCDDYYARTGGLVSYVGTWHSHPVSEPKPSETDHEGIGKLFAMNPEGGTHQLMMIVGHAASETPELGLYRFRREDLQQIGQFRTLQFSQLGGCTAVPEVRPLDAKVGLSLSGGGSRAVAFHLGTLRALEDLGYLDDVDVISSVSGGSVMTALLSYNNDPFSEVDQRATAFLSSGLLRPALLKLAHPYRLIKLLLAFASAKLPSVLLSILLSVTRLATKLLPGNARLNRWLSDVRWPIDAWYSSTHIMRDAMADVVGEQTCKAPTRDNLDVVFNACELRTATAFRMSNQLFGSWRFGWADASQLSVAEAVTASAAYPVFLPPFDWRKTFTKNNQRVTSRILVTDGGVYDNLGTTVLEPGRDDDFSKINHPVDIIIASDASAGQFKGDDLPASFKSRMSQAFSSVMRKSNDATKKRLHALAEQGDVARFVYANLGQIDQNVPIKAPGWVDREDVMDYPTDFSAMSEPNVRAITDRGESITRTLATLYLMSD